MNWSYIGIAALLPLMVALGLTMAAGALQALWLTYRGTASRPALFRMLKTTALVFPLTFLVVSLWDGRHTLRGLIGVGLHHPEDQKVMGQLRAGGVFFFKEDQAKAVYWFRLAAAGGDTEAQLLLARALRQGIGSAPDQREALQWAQTAADRGRPDAMVLSGDLLAKHNPEAANAWYHKALAANRERARKGDPQACLSYGLMHVTGKGVDKDPVEALAWMMVARSFRLGAVQDVVVQLTESRMTQTQRTDALQRAMAIRKELSQPTAKPAA